MEAGMDLKKKSTLFLMTMGPSIAVILSLTIFWGWYARSISRQETMERYRVETGFLSTVTEESVRTGDDLTMINILSDLRGNPSLEYADVIDADNIILMSLDLPRKGMNIGAEIQQLSATMRNDAARVHYRPVKGIAGHPRARHEFMKIYLNPLTRERAGFVRIGYSDAEVSEKGKEIAARVIISAILSLIVAAFLSHFMLAIKNEEEGHKKSLNKLG